MLRRQLLPLAVVLMAAAATVWADEPKGEATKAAEKAAGKKKAAKPAVRRALVKTSHGDFEIELWPEVAPKTVAAFLGMAEGKGTFTDVHTQQQITLAKPFYDGLTFHRVIKGFMLQGGCPKANGTGDAGFEYADEMNAVHLGLDKQKVVVGGQPHAWLRGLGQAYWQQKVLLPVIRLLKIDVRKINASPELQKQVMTKLQSMTLKELYELQGYKYDTKLKSVRPTRGTLALANRGPNTNGSQFFVNLGDPVYLTGKHTVFGRVSKGMDVVDKIGAVKTTGPRGKPVPDKPLEPVTILSIRELK